jgi:hypothetical protein
MIRQIKKYRNSSGKVENIGKGRKEDKWRWWGITEWGSTKLYEFRCVWTREKLEFTRKTLNSRGT